MKLFANTLTEHLISICGRNLLNDTEDRELRVFISAMPPPVVYDVGTELTDYFKSSPKKVRFIYKVAHALAREWEKDALWNTVAVKQIRQNQWIDEENRLTFYRNLQLSETSGNDCLIIVLVGVDKAIDKASLQDFFILDTETVWVGRMKQSFMPWIDAIFTEYNIPSEKTQKKELDGLLQTLFHYGVGDLLRISEFLQTINLAHAQNGNDALREIIENLLFWNLPLLKDIPARRKISDYITSAITFFSYEKYLKEKERKKASDKIEAFKVKFENGDVVPDYYGDFGDMEEFLNCLKTYIDDNDGVARARLLKANFVFIRDEILNLKEPKQKPTTKKIRRIDAPPLEAVLEAVWAALVAYKKDTQHPLDTIKTISITGVKYRHDFDNNQEARDLIRGCLGGIDELLVEHLNLGNEHDIEILCELCPDDANRPILEKTGSSIPGFQFEVKITNHDNQSSVEMFQWQLSEIQPFRILWNFTREAYCKMKEDHNQCLPVFHLTTYNELFLAADADEAQRILKIGLTGFKITNLLELFDIKTDDPLLPLLKDMAHAFGKFIEHYIQSGFFAAMKQTWPNLEAKVKKALELYYRDRYINETTQLAPLLYKAFLLLDEPANTGNTDITYWQPFEPSAIVTGLHPALLEMVCHQHVFLMTTFVELFNKNCGYSDERALKQHIWQDACDFAAIHYPLFGIITSQNKKLDTHVSSKGLIHLLGKPASTAASLNAKVLLRYDPPEEDDDISDTDLFRETRESRIIARILEEYTQVHPYAHDGITIAVMELTDIQVLIAAIDAFVKKLLVKQADEYEDLPPYHLSLILFTTGTPSQSVSSHVQAWRERWATVRDNKKYEYYQRCRISVSQRPVTRQTWQNDYLNLISKPDFEVDIAILLNFIAAGEGDDLKPIYPYIPDLWALKYPFVEIPRCLEETPATQYHRSRIISNRQFRIAALHSEISARFRNIGTAIGSEHVVISQGDFAPWSAVVDRLHHKANWVICLDPYVDERLIGKGLHPAEWKREIIGFASGVGAHGELNFTISTERASLKDIEVGIQRQLERLLGPWKKQDVQTAARFLVRKSRTLSGLSLVHATGASEAIRDLIGYTLIRVCLPEVPDDGSRLCDELISLDSFQHWFNPAESKKRTDLLRLVAHLRVDNRLHITAQLIECKFAKLAPSHLEKARVQLENSLHHLMECFWPRQKDTSRVDQRYWWAQLLRLIASKSITKKDKIDLAAALEKFAEGYFDIDWQAVAVAYWTDQPDAAYVTKEEWSFSHREHMLKIPVVYTGQPLIHSICCETAAVLLPLPTSSIHLRAAQPHAGGYAKQYQPDEEKPKPNEETREGSPDPVLVENTKIPNRIFLGIAAPNREVYWEFGHNGLANRHLLIFGKSGVGKTYAIQCLLCELARQGQNSVTVDYTNGFEDDQLEAETRHILNPCQHRLQLEPLAINPFRRQKNIIAGKELPEKSNHTAQRVMSVFASVYGLGDQQKNVLYQAIKEGLETHPQMNLSNLLNVLEDFLEGKGYRKDAAFSLLSKIQPFVDGEPFGSEHPGGWQTFYDDTNHRGHIIQMAGCGRDFARLVTEFTLIDLYWYARGCGSQYNPKVVVLDEIQNLDHSQGGPISGFLTEGRKFGLSLILATQTLSNLHTEERDRLFQAAHKLFFKPAETEIKEYARIIGNSQGEKPESWIDRLTSLGKGECYSLGPSLNTGTGQAEEKAFRIKITSLKDRLTGKINT